MKSRWIIGILVMVSLFCCGVAFAESMDKVESAQATAEDAIASDETATDMMMSDENSMSADELYAPASESVKAETSAGTDEAPKM